MSGASTPNWTYDTLLKDLEKEAGSRFAASERLNGRETKIRVGTTVATVALIILSVFLVIIPLPKFTADLVSGGSIAASVSLLALSLLQSFQSNAVQADQFSRCARELDSIRRRLELTPSLSQAEIENIHESYHNILQRYDINYEPKDYKAFLFRKAEKSALDAWANSPNTPKPRTFPQFPSATIAILGIGIVISALGAAWYFNRAYVRLQITEAQEAAKSNADIAAAKAEADAKVAAAKKDADARVASAKEESGKASLYSFPLRSLGDAPPTTSLDDFPHVSPQSHLFSNPLTPVWPFQTEYPSALGLDEKPQHPPNPGEPVKH